MSDGRVTVVIPTIPPRADKMLLAAVHSVEQQDYPRDWVDTHIITDTQRQGPARMRNLGASRADTEWLAFLDDDDTLDPHHLTTLITAADAAGADVVWPWFRVTGGRDPFPMHRGRQWNPQDPHIFPITTLVRRSAFMDVGGFPTDGDGIPDPNEPTRWVAGEDWRLWLTLSAAGARFHHINIVTWTWVHHPGNTSGLPARWGGQSKQKPLPRGPHRPRRVTPR